MDRNKPRHVFIVDNDRIFVRLLDYIFSKDLGFRFLDFKSGEDALRHMSLAPELIILDHRLPGMNGIETLLEVRETDPEVPVVTLSDESDGKLPAEFLNKGAHEHVLKTENFITELSAIIDRVLENETARTARPARRRLWRGKRLYLAILLLTLLASIGYYCYL